MTTLLKVLTMFPIMLVGYAVGFVYESFLAGIYAGQHGVASVAEGCAARLRAKREKGE
jgi:hypothetical protein